ncbi:MAG: DsbA family oxidoreductase [Alphaproteobacteria bacterium]|nr:DsbA family oxidoreductase [Alphaproteobacteria bacterium]
MRFDIFSDVVCPWCYIGKRRFARALGQRPDITPEVAWRAFQLNPDLPRDGMDRAEYVAKKFGTGRRAEEIYKRVSESGMAEGIDFRFDKIRRTPNTTDAHRLLLYAAGAGAQEPVLDRLFDGYFTEGADIGDADTLARLAGEAGLEVDPALRFLAGEQGRDQVMEDLSLAYRMGITGVPCFVLEGRYALPGAHEPEAFQPLFDLAKQEAEQPTTA